ncbi:MAG: heavy metal-associated domain-containing protein [Bacteroidales bacterium]|nr:heavy metal-associated domain-containing protein [Bacteroidales bacterium]
MKTLLFITTALLFMMSTVVTFGQTPKDGKAPMAESKPDTLKFTVYGMDCPGCEGGLEKQVNKMKSVKSSKANWRKQQLKVIPTEGANIEIDALEERVKKANLTLDKESLKEDE